MELEDTDNLLTRQDLIKILSELQQLSEQLLSAKIRQQSQLRLHLSPNLVGLLQSNNVATNNQKQIEMLILSLKRWLDNATIFHLSFAVEPNLEILSTLVKWFRQNIDQSVLVQVGLQPTIGAGMILRTQSKIYDFSIKNRLSKNQKLLEELISQL